MVKNKQKGAAPIILIVLGLVVVGGGVYMHTQQDTSSQESPVTNIIENTPVLETSSTQTKLYSSNVFNFSVNVPLQTKITETNRSPNKTVTFEYGDSFIVVRLNQIGMHGDSLEEWNYNLIKSFPKTELSVDGKKALAYTIPAYGEGGEYFPEEVIVITQHGEEIYQFEFQRRKSITEDIKKFLSSVTFSEIPTVSSNTYPVIQNVHTAQEEIPWKTYFNSDLFSGMEFKYPGDLRIREDHEGLIRSVTLLKNNSVHPAYQINEIDRTIKEYIEYENMYGEIGKPQITPIEAGIDGRLAVKALYLNYGPADVWIENNGKTIILQHSPSFGATDADFDKMIDSVKFRSIDNNFKTPQVSFSSTQLTIGSRTLHIDAIPDLIEVSKNNVFGSSDRMSDAKISPDGKWVIVIVNGAAHDFAWLYHVETGWLRPIESSYGGAIAIKEWKNKTEVILTVTTPKPDSLDKVFDVTNLPEYPKTFVGENGN